MNFNERPQFIFELKKMARQVGLKIDEEKESDAIMLLGYWENLHEFPLDVIKKAIQNAIRSRDSDNTYYFRAMITVPEIRVESRRILEVDPSVRKKSGCDKCSYTTWIIEKVKGMQPISHRCECWLAVMAMKKASQGK